jgi:hypothetical protein
MYGGEGQIVGRELKAFMNLGFRTEALRRHALPAVANVHFEPVRGFDRGGYSR